MYGGQIVETGPTGELISAPRHPYTRALLRSIPSLDEPDRAIEPIGGQVPDLVDPPPGCRFRPRCPIALPACDAPIALAPAGPSRRARCIRIDA
jgi:oligopeptide/dipeptide ABC transporter ATP-binding protein